MFHVFDIRFACGKGPSRDLRDLPMLYINSQLSTPQPTPQIAFRLGKIRNQQNSTPPGSIESEFACRAGLQEAPGPPAHSQQRKQRNQTSKPKEVSLDLKQQHHKETEQVTLKSKAHTSECISHTLWHVVYPWLWSFTQCVVGAVLSYVTLDVLVVICCCVECSSYKLGGHKQIKFFWWLISSRAGKNG